MSLFATDQTNGGVHSGNVGRGSLTLKSIVSGTTAQRTDLSWGETSSRDTAFSIDVTGNATIETDSIEGTLSHFVFVGFGTEGTQIGLGGIGTVRFEMSRFSALPTFFGNILFPVPNRFVSITIAATFGFFARQTDPA